MSAHLPSPRTVPPAVPLAALLALAAARAPAQDDPAALADRVSAEVLAALHARADELHAEKQYARANGLRLEIVQEWAPGDAKALAALGFVQIGDVWRRDMTKVVFERDLEGDERVLKRLDREWERRLRDLVRDVEGVARAFAAAEQVHRAAVWWRRLLRLRPEHPRALEQLQLEGFDGHQGTAEELRRLRRGRAIAQACDYLRRMPVAVERIPAAERQPLLAGAGVNHHGVRSAHFAVWGNLPVDALVAAAEVAERSLLLSRTLFGVCEGRIFAPRFVRDMIWVADRPTYGRVLDACADQFPGPDRLRFLKEDVELSFLTVGQEVVRLYVQARGSREVLLDQTARGVVQDAVGFTSHGLWEGIGHATCGFLFDRTLTFFLEQQQGQTVTKWSARPLVPDMQVWHDIAAESAWGRSDTPTSRLVLLHGAKFTNEERVKAWAMADFLLRDRPELLFQLDACRSDEVRTPPDVEAEFRRRTGIDLPELDDRWRHYWGTGHALRAAMRAPPSGKEDEVAAAEAIASAINAARAAADRGPIGFYVADTPDVESTDKWFGAVERAERERSKKPGREVPPPAPPDALGRRVFAHPGGDPEAAVAAWLLDPIARDELLAPGRILIGCRRGRHALVLDLAEPSGRTETGPPATWPIPGQSVGGTARAADVGPSFREALAAIGRGPDQAVGPPLSLHFHRELSRDQLRQIRCQVLVDGRSVGGGTILDAQDAIGRDAQGCVFFVPADPLPSGAEVTVRWELPHGVLPAKQSFAPITFRVR